ncbi:MAG: hypothetical protein M3N19_11965 [Candidatus Eremiobacteraeota bacterium]|nr:hypothetical protein [Candidatus Eremiobacteraeota bacterium]
MYYVEVLRVWRALRVFAICMAALVIIAAVIRMSIGSPVQNRMLDTMKSPTAHKTVQTQADGSITTIIQDDASGLRAVQTESGGVLDIKIYEKSKAAKHLKVSRDKVDAGNGSGGVEVMADEKTLPDGTHFSHFILNRHVSLTIYLLIAGMIAAIFATIIGGSLSKENDGHLELAWTKPISREAYAATVFAVDAVGIVVAGALMLLTLAACTAIAIGMPQFTADSGTLPTALKALLFPLAWYGIGQLLTASMRRGGGIVVGLMWVAALMIPAMLAFDNAFVRTVLRAVDTLNPMAYFGQFSMPGIPSPTLLAHNATSDIAALFALTIIAAIASLLQWRRLEA